MTERQLLNWVLYPVRAYLYRLLRRAMRRSGVLK